MAIAVEQCVRGLDRYGDAGFLGRSAGVRDIDLRIIARHAQLPVIRPSFDHFVCVFPLVDERVGVMVTFPDSDRVGRMWSYNHVLILSREDYLDIGANPFLLEGLAEKRREVREELPVLSFVPPPYEPSPNWGKWPPEVWEVLISAAFSDERSYILLPAQDDDLAEAVMSCLPPKDRLDFYCSTFLTHPGEKSTAALRPVFKGAGGEDPRSYQVRWCLVAPPPEDEKNDKNWQEGWWQDAEGVVIDLRDGQISWENVPSENEYAGSVAQTIRSEGSPSRRVRLLNAVPKDVGGMEAWEIVRALEEVEAADSLSGMVDGAGRIRDLSPGPLGAMAVRLVRALERAITGADEPIEAQCARRAGKELLELARRSPRERVAGDLGLVAEHLVERHSEEFRHVLGPLGRETDSLGKVGDVLLAAIERRMRWLSGDGGKKESFKEEILWWLSKHGEEMGGEAWIPDSVKAWDSRWPRFLGENPDLFLQVAEAQEKAGRPDEAVAVWACLLQSLLRVDAGSDITARVAAQYVRALWNDGHNPTLLGDGIRSFIDQEMNAVALLIPDAVKLLESSLDSGASLRRVGQSLHTLLNSLDLKELCDKTTRLRMVPAVCRICIEANQPGDYAQFMAQLPNRTAQQKVRELAGSTAETPARARAFGEALSDEGLLHCVESYAGTLWKEYRKGNLAAELILCWCRTESETADRQQTYEPRLKSLAMSIAAGSDVSRDKRKDLRKEFRDTGYRRPQEDGRGCGARAALLCGVFVLAVCTLCALVWF
jgi:hypothetical protein